VHAHTSAYGVLDLFVAGAGFDVAGAFLLARGLTASPERAARRIVQGRNSFARFDVRSAEDCADGQIGRVSLISGFLVQALAYVLSAHGAASLSHTSKAYVGLLGSAAAAILLVYGIARKAHPWLRNRWLIKFARIDNYGYVHTHPSGSELFRFGQILNIRAYQREYGNNEAYAERVFKTHVRDPNRDHDVRPGNFQPFVPLDDEHGYVSEQPKDRWRLRGKG
jgi:hypothetical protein